MSKLLSTQVKVYPTAYRGLNDTGKAYNPESRLNTEYNITNTTKSITEKRNFVISWDNSTETVLFSIQGYYFEANVNNVLSGLSGDKLYAAIKVLPIDATPDVDNIKYPAYTLVPFDTDPLLPISSDVLLDANGDFLGLNFSNSGSLGGAGVYSIQLLEKVGGVWGVPTKSLFITDTSRVEDKETGESVTKHFTSEEITADVGNISTLNIMEVITGADFGDEVVIKRVNITNKAVDTSKLEDDAVTTGKIKDYNITESKIASDSIISVKIKNGAVTSAKIGTGEVKTGNIADSAVTTVKLDANAVTNAKIANDAVTSEKIKAGEVKTGNIADSAVSTGKIADSAVKTAKIDGGAVTEGKLADSAVTENKIKNGAVTEGKLATDSVITTKIKDKNVTEGKIEDKAVSTDKLATDAVTTDKIINDAITTDKIIDSAITDDKIKGIDATYSGINGAKLRDSTISRAKIINLAVDNSKIDNGTIENTKLKQIEGSYLGITGNRIKAGEITGGTSGHLASSTITNSNIVDGTIENVKLKNSSITVGGGSVSLGGTIAKDTILGVSGNGIIARTGDNTYINTAGTPGTVLVTGALSIKWTQPDSEVEGEGIISKASKKLTNKRKLWGVDFDGTDDINGSLSNVGNVARNLSSGTYNIGTSDFPFTNIYSTNFYATSDERLKEDIKEFKYERSVLDIPIKTFRYKDNPEKEHIGFIAQDLQKYFPELVTSGEEGYLSINENKLVYLLIEEVKQLKVEVEKLRR